MTNAEQDIASEGIGARAALSAVVPCYRCVKTIGRAVNSIFRQTLRPLEVILVEDGSGDATLAELEKLRDSYPDGWIKVIALPRNAGPATARNLGWDAATQPYIAFLDADDTWHPWKVAIQYEWMRQHPEAALTGHLCRQIKEGDKEGSNDDFQGKEAHFAPLSRWRLLLGSCFSTPSVMLRRDLPVRFAGGKRYAEDYLLWLEIAWGGGGVYLCDWALANLYKAPYGEDGLSAELWLMEQGELHAYWTIYRKGFIGTTTYWGLRAWSLLRFGRRLIKTKRLK
ncbi:glycosyltransferase family 2 protein [Desulfurivibrio sp. D14AmB]|uniref:glycosyltransferase family 2 protein n=1 Tax=Desulfurivibrio sp. D14AmB TaxID=3374370 RepID=UPI00376F2DA3